MKPLILLTNDDGIYSPGLAAAASALDPLGDLLIVAPQEQQTSMARSRSQICGGDGTITKTKVEYQGKTWAGYGVKATPALAVVHAVHELADRPISLSVSGINYGENVATCVTASGTLGAALEAAEYGIPSLAVSLEIDSLDYHSYNTVEDFSTAIHFTTLVAAKILSSALPQDADVLKLEIPCGASPHTPLVVTRQDRLAYYQSVMEPREKLFGTKLEISQIPSKGKYTAKNTDAFALAEGLVSVTPLSLDLTARNCLDQIAEILESETLTEED
jgi:5'-nucleotidase